MEGCFLREREGIDWGREGQVRGEWGSSGFWELWPRERKIAGDMEEYRSKLVYSLWKSRKVREGVGKSANVGTAERSRWQSLPSISKKAILPKP